MLLSFDYYILKIQFVLQFHKYKKKPSLYNSVNIQRENFLRIIHGKENNVSSILCIENSHQYLPWIQNWSHSLWLFFSAIYWQHGTHFRGEDYLGSLQGIAEQKESAGYFCTVFIIHCYEVRPQGTRVKGHIFLFHFGTIRILFNQEKIFYIIISLSKEQDCFVIYEMKVEQNRRPPPYTVIKASKCFILPGTFLTHDSYFLAPNYAQEESFVLGAAKTSTFQQ